MKTVLTALASAVLTMSPSTHAESPVALGRQERRPRPWRLRRRLRLAGASTPSSRRTATTSAIVQNPTTSLADDVAFTKRVVAQQDGPVLLVGHSYGGVVITEAGNDPKVAGLVYIAAFAPDKGESVRR